MASHLVRQGGVPSLMAMLEGFGVTVSMKQNWATCARLEDEDARALVENQPCAHAQLLDLFWSEKIFLARSKNIIPNVCY